MKIEYALSPTDRMLLFLYLRGVLIDALGAAGTLDSHNTAMEVLDFNKHPDLSNRYLLSVSLTPKPHEGILIGK